MLNTGNLYLFNMTSEEVSARTIKNIVMQLGDEEHSLEKIKLIIGDGAKYHNITKVYDVLDKNFMPTYALSLSKISMIIVEKIVNREKNLEVLYDNLKSISQELNLQARIIYEIEDFCKKTFERNPNSEQQTLKHKIINKFSINKKGMTVVEVWKSLQNSGEIVSFPAVSNIISVLYQDKKLTINQEGYVLQLPNLWDVIEQLNEYDKDVLTMKIKGFTLQNIADKFIVSRQRIQQKINKVVSSMPIVLGEQKYSEIFIKYKLSAYARNVLFKDDIYFSNDLYCYIQIKYLTDVQTERDVEYLLDHNLMNTQLAKSILANKNIIVHGNQIIDSSFFNLFKVYLEENNIVKFSSSIFKKFVSHLKEKNVKTDFDPTDDPQITARKFENSSSFIFCKGKFLYIDKIVLNDEISDVIEVFLDSITGLASTQFLINEYPELMKKHYLETKHEVHAFLKCKYSDKNLDVYFSRSPHIERINYDKQAFIQGLIELYQPIQVNEFLDSVHKHTGIQQTTFANYASEVIKMYTDGNYIEMVKHELTEGEREFLLYTLGEFMILESVFENKVNKSEYKNKSAILTRRSVLNLVGFKRIGRLFLSQKFNTVSDAFCEWLTTLPQVFDKDVLFTCIDESYLKYNLNSFFTNLDLIALDDTQLMNVAKVMDKNRLLNFRDSIINEIEDEEIFTIKYLKNNPTINEIFNTNTEITSFGEKFIINLLTTSSSVSNNTGDVVIMRKGSSVVKNDLIENLVNQYEHISSLELYSKIYSKYGLDSDITPKNIEDLGYYYSRSTQDIYKSKELYKKKVRGFLDD